MPSVSLEIYVPYRAGESSYWEIVDRSKTWTVFFDLDLTLSYSGVYYVGRREVPVTITCPKCGVTEEVAFGLAVDPVQGEINPLFDTDPCEPCVAARYRDYDA